MPARSNYDKNIFIQVSLYLSVIACTCLALPQENEIPNSVFLDDNTLRGSFETHTFIDEPGDSLGKLLAFKTPSNTLRSLANLHFDVDAKALPDAAKPRKFKLTFSELNRTLKADCELMRSGRREYFPGSFSRQWSMFRFIVHSFRIEQTMIRSAASLWFTDYLEASASMWAEGIGRTTRIDLKVTFRRIPLFKQARLVSRYFQVSSPRSMWHEPWLERGYKFNVGDISLTEGRLYSNLELQFPEILGGRGIVGALSLNAERGLGLGFNIDLPNYTIPGTSLKVKMPDIRFVLFH